MCLKSTVSAQSPETQASLRHSVPSVSLSPGQERFVCLNPWPGTGRQAHAKKQRTGWL